MKVKSLTKAELEADKLMIRGQAAYHEFEQSEEKAMLRLTKEDIKKLANQRVK